MCEFLQLSYNLCLKEWSIKLFSIYTLSDLGVLSNLIGSLSLANEHYSSPMEWIMRKPNKNKMADANAWIERSIKSMLNGFFLKKLLRSLLVYILKQLLFSISVNSGRIFTSPLVNYCACVCSLYTVTFLQFISVSCVAKIKENQVPMPLHFWKIHEVAQDWATWKRANREFNCSRSRGFINTLLEWPPVVMVSSWHGPWKTPLKGGGGSE